MFRSAVMLNVGSPSGNWGVQKGSASSKTYSTYSTFPQKECTCFEQVAFWLWDPQKNSKPVSSKNGDTDRHKQEEERRQRKGQREKPR